jgi:hypothetical protein
MRRSLPVDFSSTVLLVHDRARPFLLKALIFGPPDTPYDSGAFSVRAPWAEVAGRVGGAMERQRQGRKGPDSCAGKEGGLPAGQGKGDDGSCSVMKADCAARVLRWFVPCLAGPCRAFVSSPAAPLCIYCASLRVCTGPSSTLCVRRSTQACRLK